MMRRRLCDFPGPSGEGFGKQAQVNAVGAHTTRSFISLELKSLIEVNHALAFSNGDPINQSINQRAESRL